MEATHDPLTGTTTFGARSHAGGSGSRERGISLKTDAIAAACCALILGITLVDLAVDLPLVWASSFGGPSTLMNGVSAVVLPPQAVQAAKAHYQMTVQSAFLQTAVVAALVLLAGTVGAAVAQGTPGPYLKLLVILCLFTPYFVLVMLPTEQELLVCLGDHLAHDAKILGYSHLAIVGALLYALWELLG